MNKDYEVPDQILPDPVEMWIEGIPEVIFLLIIIMLINLVMISRLFTI